MLFKVIVFLYLFFQITSSSDNDNTSPLDAIQESLSNTALSKELFKHIQKDTEGNRDFYTSIPRQSQQQWAHYLNLNSEQILDNILDQRIKWHVHVKLIGFSGEGNFGLALQEIDVAKYLKSLKGSQKLVEIETGKKLGIYGQFQFTVSKVAKHVSDEIEGAIKGQLNQQEINQLQQENNIYLVPYQTVDSIVQREYHSSSGMFTIFILNPKNSLQKNYVYSYNDSPESCPGNFWVDGNMSYMWVDLTAYPITYGPSEKGEGKVLPHSFPRIQNYKQNVAKLGLLADVANMIQSAAKQMVATPIQKLPVKSPLGNIQIKIIHLHDTPKWIPPEIPQLNIQLIKQQLNSLLYNQQQLNIIESYVSMGSCDVCITAYTNALKVKRGMDPKSDLPPTNLAFLDSDELIYWMIKYQQKILKIAGIEENPRQSMIVPVFLFHVMYDHVLLLDSKFQTIGKKGVVVGVVSRAGETVSEYACMGHPALLQPNNITRAVMSSILEGVWGVPPPEITYNEGTGPGYDFKWTVGHNPYGLLSTSTTLPFFQKMSAMRNMLLAIREQLILQITPLLLGFQEIANQNNNHPTTREFLIELRARQNLLLFKIQRGMQLCGRWQFEGALQLLNSASHDAVALRQIAVETYRLCDGRIRCHEKDHSGTIILGFIFGVLGLGMVILFITIVITLLRTRRTTRRRGKKAL